MKFLRIIAVVSLLFPADSYSQQGGSDMELLLQELEDAVQDPDSTADDHGIDWYLADSVRIADFDTSYFLPGDPEYNLIRAAEFGQFEVVRVMIERGINVDARTSQDVTPLMYASQNGDTEIVKYLIGKGADVNARPDNRVTPLIGASRTGYYEVVDVLLEAGAEVDIRDELGLTALMHAVAYNYPDVTELLVKKGADVEKGDDFGTRPLMMATYYNCIESADVLLENGADPDGKDNFGFTPLMVAAQHGDYDIAWQLLDRGADPGIRNLGGLNAMALAVMNGDEDFVELLLESGADINQSLNASTNSLALADESNDKEMAAFLIENGARRNQLPELASIRGGLELNFNGDDFMMGFQAGISEGKYKLYLTSGFLARLTAVRVLRPENDTLSFQMWERRYVWPLSLGRDFVLFKDGSQAFGCRLHLTGAYTWGNYRGSGLEPDPRYLVIPGAGITWKDKYFGISFDYQYVPIKVHDISSHRFRLVIEGFYDIRPRLRYTQNHISWF
jgi:ankyrin repeat protein